MGRERPEYHRVNPTERYYRQLERLGCRLRLSGAVGFQFYSASLNGEKQKRVTEKRRQMGKLR